MKKKVCSFEESNQRLKYLRSSLFSKVDSVLLLSLHCNIGSSRVEKTINLGFGSIYRKVKDYRQIYQGDQYMQMIHKLQSSSNYRLQVAAEDAHHCEGYLADIYIKSSAYIIIITIIFTMINSVFIKRSDYGGRLGSLQHLQ